MVFEVRVHWYITLTSRSRVLTSIVMEKNYGEEEFGWSPKHSVLNSYISGTWEAFDMLFWESRTGAADSGAEEDQGYIYIWHRELFLVGDLVSSDQRRMMPDSKLSFRNLSSC